MGLLSYIKGDSTNVATDDIPLRSKREQCWESRDLFNKCLDLNQVENPLDPRQKSIVDKKCHNEDIRFQQNCAKSWVQYFKEKRYVDIKKEKMLKQVELENAELVNMPGVRK